MSAPYTAVIVTVPLNASGRVALLQMPTPMCRADFDRVVSYVSEILVPLLEVDETKAADADGAA